jgi:putative IMPACT (imprinted ancient) family translation regulator
MVVKVSKPEINVREKISELDKPSGTAGQAMLAAETPQEQQALVGVGRRNLIINGDMRIAQRGTSYT